MKTDKQVNDLVAYIRYLELRVEQLKLLLDKWNNEDVAEILVVERGLTIEEAREELLS